MKSLLVIISISTLSLYGANTDDDENFLKILLDMRRLGQTPRASLSRGVRQQNNKNKSNIKAMSFVEQLKTKQKS